MLTRLKRPGTNIYEWGKIVANTFISWFITSIQMNLTYGFTEYMLHAITFNTMAVFRVGHHRIELNCYQLMPCSPNWCVKHITEDSAPPEDIFTSLIADYSLIIKEIGGHMFMCVCEQSVVSMNVCTNLSGCHCCNWEMWHSWVPPVVTLLSFPHQRSPPGLHSGWHLPGGCRASSAYSSAFSMQGRCHIHTVCRQNLWTRPVFSITSPATMIFTGHPSVQHKACLYRLLVHASVFYELPP